MTFPTTDLLPARAITHLMDDVQEEKRRFARDARRDDNGHRAPIDPFRYRRYQALGWIRENDYPPYYELTSNGELICQWYQEWEES